MTRRRIIKLFAILTAAVVAVVAAGTIYISHASRQSAIDTATTWARLAPLPSSAKNLQVDVKGVDVHA